jgi:hypothetical protein
MPITESDWAQLSTVQGPTSPRGTTLAAANTIAPNTFLTILTGNVVIKTITPPVPFGHMLALLFAGVAGVDATGNIATLKASVVGEVMLLVYNPAQAKYHPVG